jgi:folate-dependent phosphoribosylglycinamide formyltransferase PurN
VRKDVTAATKKIVLLGGNNPTTWIVYNELVQQFGLFPVVIENGVSRSTLIKNRTKKIGMMRVLSQVGFALLIRPLLFYRDRNRIHYLQRKFGNEDIQPINSVTHLVKSVNDPACHALIDTLKPDIVVVNGTRILSKKTLARINAPVINTHQGITPGYRGAHGAYWALVQNDRKNCGVTVHLVDEGIDTGNIISQAIVETEAADSFVTYPYLQTAVALDLLVDAIRKIQVGNLKSIPISGASAVWYHPGFFQYIGNALRGVR